MTLSEIWEKRQMPITDPNPIDSRIEISVDCIKLNGKQYTFDEFNAIADNVITEDKRIENTLDEIDNFIDEINSSEKWIGKDLYSNNHIKLKLIQLKSILKCETDV